MITDVRLEALDPQLPSSPPDVSDPFVARVLKGTSFYGTLEVRPMLTMTEDGPQPVKTVPAHFSPVSLASAEDVDTVFGGEDGSHFYIGTPLEMEQRLHLDLAELVKRSSGVFGKSGTGKTFLTRMLLLGIAQKHAAVNLVFDMHNEYGWQGSAESGRTVKGLKQLFDANTVVFSLDPESSRRRHVQVDHYVQVGWSEIEPEDVSALAETLNLTEAGTAAAFRLQRRYGQEKWLESFLALGDRESMTELTAGSLEHEGTLQALHRRLEKLSQYQFLAKGKGNDSVGAALGYLDKGMHVVLEFGRYSDDLTAYMLVANLLTRRIHARYVQMAERAMGDRSQMPRPLVITIEEAHKFLSPQVARQTIFGTIAREMRKYNVTLLVVDQRPSGIDTEIMSQIGTKFACLLDDERDVDAVLSGVAGRSELRRVLARLESKQQALIFGHALPMPVVVQTREYGSEESYREFGFRDALERKKKSNDDLKDLFG
jgi:DNA helicase HerA-like ATPase